MEHSADELLLAPLSATEVDELLTTFAGPDKRGRRTEIERLSRRRRQASLQAQRAQLQQLEAQLAALLAGHARRARDPEKLPTRLLETETERAPVTRERFIEASLEAERLEAAQTRLRQALRAKLVMASSLQSLAAGCVDQWQEAVPRPLVDLEYTPRRVGEYMALLRDALGEVATFEALLARDRSGETCMGWHLRQQSHARFALTSLAKRLRGRRDDGEPLMRATWALLSSEQQLRHVFGDWSDGIRCRVLYDVTEDAVVLYRTFERRHVAKRFHSIVLLYRVHTDDGFVIGTRTIPSLGVQSSLQLPDKWVTICEWIRFRRVPATVASETETAVEVTFGVAHPTPLPAPRWRLATNFFTTVLRWEGALATPMALTWS